MSMDEKSPSALEAAKSALPEITDNENEQTDTQDIEEPLATVPTKNSVNVPYSAFKRSQKHTIVAIVALAGLASTLSANIYFPALNAIQADFGTSSELINLTISLYMIFQGLSPSLWGSLADQWGRRPVYLCTMVVYLGANIGLALAPNYPALLVLRMLQAFGSSSVIAIGAGCIGDIASPSERGTYFGVYSAGPMLGPILGPIIGGGIAQSLGWRWIFWLLMIIAAVLFMMVLFFLPETLRSLVGDGSGYANPTPSEWWKKRVLKKDSADGPVTQGKSRWLKVPNVLQPFRYALQPDVAFCLIANAIPYSVFYCVLASTSNLFGTIYNLNEMQIGLSYIANGCGCILGGLIEGRVLDRDFRTTSTKHGYDSSNLSRGSLGPDFPIFEARLRNIWTPLFLFDALIIVYGFLLNAKVHLAGVLVVQFFLGISCTAIFNLFQTLLIDLYPKQSASITASNNLVRCLLGAAATAVIQPGINGIGVHYMFLTLALISIAMTPCILVIRRFGPKWRRNRMERIKAASLKAVNEKQALSLPTTTK